MKKKYSKYSEEEIQAELERLDEVSFSPDTPLPEFLRQWNEAIGQDYRELEATQHGSVAGIPDEHLRDTLAFVAWCHRNEKAMVDHLQEEIEKLRRMTCN